ncbi:MAG: hypothetical protein JNM98_09985 [Rhodocyclaceae bacterium]|nr:hypothetical protein [Rhodocyclaceae bacterium]
MGQNTPFKRRTLHWITCKNCSHYSAIADLLRPMPHGSDKTRNASGGPQGTQFIGAQARVDFYQLYRPVWQASEFGNVGTTR